MNGQTEGTVTESDIEEQQPDTGAEPTAVGATGAADEAADPLAELQAKADENWNNYLRAAAELENVRKRAARDVDNARKFALERFSADLLDVRDSLEIGLVSSESMNSDQLRAGSEATLKLLVTTMERFGVTEIDPQGEPFDPEHHEAMTMQASAEVEPGTVLTVFQKGYLLNGRLLRPARVIVAQEPPVTGDDE